MKAILPLDIWNNGVTITALYINLYITYDDLATQAALHYALCDTNQSPITEGQVLITGQDYLNWGSSNDSNEEAYIIATTQLNITIDPNPPVPPVPDPAPDEPVTP